MSNQQVGTYVHQQTSPETAKIGNEVIELEDCRLPWSFLRWYNTNYNNYRYISVLPQDRSQVFQAGTSNKIIYQVATAAHVCVSWPESLFTYKCRLLTTATDQTTEILKSTAAAGTYARVAGLSSGALAASSAASNSSSTSCIYIRNSNCVFSQIDVKDMASGQIIDQNLNPGLLAQLKAGGQDMMFWEPRHGQYVPYLCGVNKFRDYTWYWPKAACPATDMFPSRLIPVVNGDVIPTGSAVYFDTVQKQQMYMWASTNGGTDGGEIIVCPFSDYLENNQMCFSQYNKHSVEFTVNTYAGAFTDVANYLYIASSAAGSSGTWTASTTSGSSASAFQLYDCKLRLKKYYITNECVARFNELANGPGIEIPFCKLWQMNSTFFNTQNQITLTINDPRITDLQKVALVIRTVNDSGQNATYDKFMFRTMCTKYLDTATGGTSAYAGGAASGITAANNIAVGQSYDGLWRVSARYAQEPIPYEDYLYLAPYHFDVAKRFAGEVFETENGENNLQLFQYDGIDVPTASTTAVPYYQNCQTQFFIGFDFRCIRGAEGSGLNISKSPLDITLELKQAHASTDNSYQVDAFLLVGSAVNCKIGGISIKS